MNNTEPMGIYFVNAKVNEEQLAEAIEEHKKIQGYSHYMGAVIVPEVASRVEYVQLQYPAIQCRYCGRVDKGGRTDCVSCGAPLPVPLYVKPDKLSPFSSFFNSFFVEGTSTYPEYPVFSAPK